MYLLGKFVVTVVYLLQLAKEFKTKSPVLLESQLLWIFFIIEVDFSQSMQICNNC